MIEIDPTRDDFFKAIVEARARIKKDSRLSVEERNALGYFLKILANAGSYGLFVEVNPTPAGTDPKTGKPARAQLRVFSGEQVFEQTAPVVEESGLWYCPVFAALITAGGRLLLALLERMVADAGGNHLMCDTDSMAIVASENGGVVPCVGGEHRLPDGREAIKSLSFADVRGFVARFEELNPYDRNAVTEPILKIEKVNFSPDGNQRELWGYAIAAKRYALFTKEGDCEI
jgi:DNA polymerase elongation subunit (family B)